MPLNAPQGRHPGNMKNLGMLFVVLAAGLSVSGCQKTMGAQMDQYITFYYPVTGQSYYEIVFDWGTYIVQTSSAADAIVHPDSEPYRGFMSLRPCVSGAAPREQLATYLTTPKGEVWRTYATDIPESSDRDESVEEEAGTGTSTTTSTIKSSLEPVVEHFHGHRDQWQKYADIEGVAGKYALKRVK